MTETQTFIRLCQLVDNFRHEQNQPILPSSFLGDLLTAHETTSLAKYGVGELDQLIAAKILEQEALTESKKELLLASLEAKYEVSQDTGGVIKNAGLIAWDVHSQLESSYYWRSLKSYWQRESPMSDDVIKAIDIDTNDILSWCGNPNDKYDWTRTGLVMGHVQSGKTTNFSALINKAFDVGYQHVVVLAGLTNSLRRQTQERLDETVLGRSSESDRLNRLELGVASYRETGIDQPQIIALTRESKDFNQLANDQLDIVESSGIKILWVVKKNVKVLEALTAFLSTKLSKNGRKLDGPLLVIDDEADNASVDTKYGGDTPSAINKQIRMLLKCARRYSYVGYTATPFANIFIDPEQSDNEILSDELFPRDFIKSLEPADNYIGPHKLFKETEALYDKCVVSLDELEEGALYESYSKYNDHIPPSHKSSRTIDALPTSLSDAVLLFIAFCAYRIKSKTDSRHASMLVNVSLYNAVQSQVYDLIGDLLRDLRSDVVTYGYRDDWRSSEMLSRMAKVYKFQNMPRDLGYEFDEIRKDIEGALDRIEQYLVNMSKESKELKYPKGEAQGKFVLAIGGLALSRGLTLEGLAVSYIIRNVGAKDTLLQTARWFGYRDGYADACRIFMPGKLEQRFLETATTIEELREDLRRMVHLKKTPQEFGLRVRHSGMGLSVTAPTKMGTGEKILHSADYAARHVQYAEVDLDHDKIEFNRNLLSSFVNRLDNWKLNGEALVSREQSVDKILSLLGDFSSDHVDFSLTSTDELGRTHNLVTSYISERRHELMLWDVVMPFSKTPRINKLQAVSTTIAIERLLMQEQLESDVYSDVSKLFLRQRFSGVFNENKFRITKNGSVADQLSREVAFTLNDETLRADFEKLRNEEVFEKMNRPILFVHAVQAAEKGKQDPLENPIFTLSLCFPGSSVPAKSKWYVVNPVYRRQVLEAQLIDTEQEEVLSDE